MDGHFEHHTAFLTKWFESWVKEFEKNELPGDANIGVEPNIIFWSWLVSKLLPFLTEMTLKMTFDPKNICKTHKWPHIWIACTRKHGISGILQGSSSNRSCNLALTSSGGSQIGFCTNRPPEVKLNLFAMVFENLLSIPDTIPDCKT